MALMMPVAILCHACCSQYYRCSGFVVRASLRRDDCTREPEGDDLHKLFLIHFDLVFYVMLVTMTLCVLFVLISYPCARALFTSLGV